MKYLRKYNEMFKWPKIDGFNAKSKSKNYLFEDEENRIHELLDQVKISEDDGMTIAVTGERGNGKTSFLLRIRDQLIQRKKSEQCKKVGLWVLPIVNPSYFSDHLSILEILVASIQSNLQTQKEKHVSDIYKIESIEMSIENVGDIIAQMRISREKSASTTSTQDYICQSSDIINISQKISELITNYLNFLSVDRIFDRLVLIVDDLDLVDNNLIYKAWSDIQNILSLTPLIMILSYRETQLRQALDYQLITENSALLAHNQINMEEIRSRVTARIEKQIPDQHKVMLKPAQIILQENILNLVFPFYNSKYDELPELLTKMLVGPKSDSNEKIKVRSMTGEQWLNWFFKIRLGMRWTPLAGYEKVEQLKPVSLREFVDLFQMTIRIADVLSENNYNSALLIAKDYYLNRAKKLLPQDLNEALVEFDHAQAGSKNMIIYSKLFSLEGIIRTGGENMDIPEYMKEPINILAKESTLATSLNNEPILQTPIVLAKDVSLGDVIHIISLLEMQCEPSVHLGMFFATIKLLYSVELQFELELANRAQGEIEKKTAIKRYASLINGIFMPEEYSYFAKGLNGYEEFNNDINTSNLTVRYDVNNNISTQLEEMRYTKYAFSSDYGRYKLDGVKKHVGNNLSQAIRYSNRPYFVTETSEEDHVTKARYRIDFYAPLAKENYVNKYFDESKEFPVRKMLPYVLRDVFDIDYFMMHQYTQKAQLGDALKEVVDNVNENVLEVQETMIQETAYYVYQGNLYFVNPSIKKEKFIEINIEAFRQSITVAQGKNRAVIELEKSLINSKGEAVSVGAQFARENLERIKPIISDVMKKSNTKESIEYSDALSEFVKGYRKQYNVTIRRDVQDLYSKLKNLVDDMGEAN